MANRRPRRKTGIATVSSYGGSIVESDLLEDIGLGIAYRGNNLVDNTDAETKLVSGFKEQLTRRANVYGPRSVGAKTMRRFRLRKVSKSDESKRFLMDSLSKNLFLSNLSINKLGNVVDAMDKEELKPKTKLLTAGDIGDVLYVVESGKLNIEKDGRIIETLGSGSVFGEFSLLYEKEVDSTVVSATDALVWSLGERVFRQIMAMPENGLKEFNLRSLKEIVLLQEPEFTEDILQIMASEVNSVRFSAGSAIIKKGEKGELLYFITNGKVRVTKGSGRDVEFSRGDYFGEYSMLSRKPRSANVVALEDVECLVMYRETFEKCFTQDIRDLLDTNFSFRVLNSLPLLCDIDQGVRKQLIDEFVLMEFDADDQIICPSDTEKILYVIYDGTVERRRHKSKDILGRGEMFGEDVFCKDTKYLYEVIAKGPCRCFALERAAVETLIGPLKHFKDIYTAVFQDQAVVTNAKRLNLSDLHILDTIGKGGFSKVKLAEHRGSGTPFALKVLSKGNIVKLHQQVNLVMEKKVLEQCDHPFILKFHKSFQDDQNIYMMTEIIHGGELYHYLRKYGPDKGIPVEQVKFYTACIVEAVTYLHKRSIMYRDLKPENLMIDSKGYLRLVDFGFAKQAVDKTYTVCGTPEYFAPELLRHEGYDRSVDIWAIGIITYEMITGKTPFVNSNQLAQAKSILKDEVKFPDTFPVIEQNFISMLLRKDPKKRPGSLDADELKRHEWFIDIDWGKLYRKEIQAPYAPTRRYSKKTISELKIPDEESPQTDFVALNEDDVAFFADF